MFLKASLNPNLLYYVLLYVVSQKKWNFTISHQNPIITLSTFYFLQIRRFKECAAKAMLMLIWIWNCPICLFTLAAGYKHLPFMD